MNTIIVKLKGGLGNQLFEYAAAKAIAIKNNSKIKFDTSDFAVDEYGRSLTIQKYNTEISLFSSALWEKIITPGNRYYGVFKRLNLIDWKVEKGFFIHQDFLKIKKPITYLEGYWQSDLYFRDIREVLLQEFSPRTEKIHIKQFVETSLPVVAVHVRQKHGQLADPNKPIDIRYGCLPIEYYSAAFKYFNDHLGKVCFVVFSDDMNWCKENFTGFQDEIIYWDDKNASEDYLQLYLMSQCNHQIIANSSFSWWGAWLNQKTDKIVIRPERPFNDPDLLYENHYPQDWIAI